MQSKRQTLVEVFTNTGVGFMGSWLITYFVIKYPVFGYAETITSVTVLCTVWSIVRSYCIRRFFNWQNNRSFTYD